MDRHDRAVIDLGNIRDYIEDLKRERDEAYRQKTEWQAAAGRLAAERDTLKVTVEVLQIEGDKARASLDASRKIRSLNERDYDQVTSDLRKALADVERLRAAQREAIRVLGGDE